jgi:hypothetical protein
MKIILNIDGPHSGEYSREVAAAVTEGVRTLNHASTYPARGLDYASDVDSVLHSLRSAASRLPQLLHQLAGWLQSLYEAGRLADDRGRDPGPVLADTLGQLSAAITHADRLSAALREAGEATAHMRTLEAPDA